MCASVHTLECNLPPGKGWQKWRDHHPGPFTGLACWKISGLIGKVRETVKCPADLNTLVDSWSVVRYASRKEVALYNSSQKPRHRACQSHFAPFICPCPACAIVRDSLLPPTRNSFPVVRPMCARVQPTLERRTQRLPRSCWGRSQKLYAANGETRITNCTLSIALPATNPRKEPSYKVRKEQDSAIFVFALHHLHRFQLWYNLGPTER